jgi:hypothetical protein
MAVVTIHITENSLGTTIANNGTLNGIILTSIPHGYHTKGFELVDDSSGSDITLFNIYIPTSSVSINSVLMGNAGIPYTNLTVRNIAAGTELDIRVDDGT